MTGKYSRIYLVLTTVLDSGQFHILNVFVDHALINRDLIVTLAQPARVWADSLEMPALESWDKEARWRNGSLVSIIITPSSGTRSWLCSTTTLTILR